MLTPQQRVRASLHSLRRNKWNKNVSVSERIRNTLSLAELKEVRDTADRLKQWSAIECPDDTPLGRPRLYFTFDRPQLEAAIRECTLEQPDLSQGFNSGWAFDGIEAWRVTLKTAYVPSYFWVAVQSGKTCPGNVRYDTYSFHCPWRATDVLVAVERLKPPECKIPVGMFRWTASWNPPTMGMPWPVERKFTTGKLRAFFGLSRDGSKFLVGTSAAPAQRCGNKNLELLGASGLKVERVRFKLAEYATGKPGWFVATSQSLKAVAKMCSAYARKELLK